MGDYIKRESVESSSTEKKDQSQETVVSLSSSNDSSSSSDFSGVSDQDHQLDVESNPKKKKQRVEAVLPVGFLDPIRPVDRMTTEERNVGVSTAIVPVKEESFHKAEAVTTVALRRNCKQFWKAGDYEESSNARTGFSDASDGDMDHVRVHPRFLHSNATSHKWALGAFAELLDNALDEVCNGATYVNVDLLENIKDKSKMVLIQDNGGGMTLDKMRQCMSLGYSAKSKMANTIGQYGNGFKTSTMRLGADVIVFSRCQGKFGDRTTQSIGMLSYTFLQNTGKEDIMVPMIDYEKIGETWSKRVRSNSVCWQTNLEAIVQWSPYESEEDLLHQFDFLEDQGTRIVIYNLWEDDQGLLELDLENDGYDIQIRDGNKDTKISELAALRPSAWSFLTYRFSLRTYTSILYRRMPPNFRIILRGKEVQHHDLTDDMIHIQEHVYKPAACAASKDPNMSAVVKLGFIRDAGHHIDVQGFNVYHKNRLIRPFWRVWNAAGSDGRGVIGVLEANFVEPAHDKQGFERTTALSRLEARLMQFQKNYWSTKCQLIGYAQRRNKSGSAQKEASPIANDNSSSKDESAPEFTPKSNGKKLRKPPGFTEVKSEKISAPLYVEPLAEYAPGEALPVRRDESKGDGHVFTPTPSGVIFKLNQENHSLRKSLENVFRELQYEKDKNKSLQEQLQDSAQMIQKMDQEQEVFVSSFAEERSRRDEEEQNMRTRLKEASETIQALLNKVKRLEGGTGFH